MAGHRTQQQVPNPQKHWAGLGKTTIFVVASDKTNDPFDPKVHPFSSIGQWHVADKLVILPIARLVAWNMLSKLFLLNKILLA